MTMTGEVTFASTVGKLTVPYMFGLPRPLLISSYKRLDLSSPSVRFSLPCDVRDVTPRRGNKRELQWQWNDVQC